jgi:hypothetical protein
MKSNPVGLEISEEEAEKLEMTCGFCDRRVRIRSLEDHARKEHFKNLINN